MLMFVLKMKIIFIVNAVIRKRLVSSCFLSGRDKAVHILNSCNN